MNRMKTMKCYELHEKSVIIQIYKILINNLLQHQIQLHNAFHLYKL